MSRIAFACTLVMIVLGCLTENGVSCDFNLSFTVESSKVFKFKEEDFPTHSSCVFCITIQAEATSCTVTKEGIVSVLKKGDLKPVLNTPEVTENFYFYISQEKCPEKLKSTANLVKDNLESSFSDGAKKVGASWKTRLRNNKFSGIDWSVSDDKGTASTTLEWNNPDKKMKIAIEGYGYGNGDQQEPSQQCRKALVNRKSFKIEVDTTFWRRDRVMV
jgi:hypothetical protein